jgi:hypothetical protein
MPKYDLAGRPLNNVSVKIAAAQTTAQLGTPGDLVPGRDYLERVILTAATTAVGAVNVFDGTTSILLHNAQITGFLGSNVTIYEIGSLATSTKGFNITTGSSITCLAVGRFGTHA